MLSPSGPSKGPRPSYLQWLEGGVARQVVFEILSPSNRGPGLALKFTFYETYGVEEYYISDPDFSTLEGWLRENGTLQPIAQMNGWGSPRLSIRFELSGDGLRLYRPDGQPLLTEVELDRLAEEWRHRAENEQHRADEEQRRADDEKHRADEEQRRAERLAAQLKALGIEPEP